MDPKRCFFSCSEYGNTYSNGRVVGKVDYKDNRGGGPPLGVHPFLNFKGAKGLKVSIWSMMEGSKKNFGFHQP